MTSWYGRSRLHAGMLVAVAGIGLAACGQATSSTHSTSSSRSSSTPKRSSSQTSSTRSPSGSSSTPAAVAACDTAALSASLGQPSGAAGTTYYPLLLTDVSSRSCTLYGYPGVSLVVSASGSQVGRSASRVAASEQTVTLEPGQSAQAILGIEVAQNYPTSTCQPTKVGGVRVYPPDQTAALYVSAPELYGCANRSVDLLTIEPLTRAQAGTASSSGGATS